MKELIELTNELLEISDFVHRKVKLIQEKIMRKLHGEETEGHDESPIESG